MDSKDFRKLIDLFESTQVDPEQPLNEGPINKIMAKMGNAKAQGVEQRETIAKSMMAAYSKWLGMTKRSGTPTDMKIFFGRIGFTQPQVTEVLARSLGEEPTVPAQPQSSPAAGNQAAPDTSTGSEPNTNSAAHPVPRVDTPDHQGRREPNVNRPKPAVPQPSADQSQAAPQSSTEQPTSQEQPQNQPAAKAASAPPLRNPENITAEDVANWENRLKNATQKVQELMQSDPQRARNIQLIANKYQSWLDQYQQYKKQNNVGESLQLDLSSLVMELAGNVQDELPLSKSQTKNLFSDAAAYAIDNELVRTRIQRMVNNPRTVTGVADTPTQPVQSSQSTPPYRNSYSPENSGDASMSPNDHRSSAPKDNGSAGAADQTSASGKMRQQWLKQHSAQDLRDLAEIAKTNSSTKSLAPDDFKKMAFVGFLFLKYHG